MELRFKFAAIYCALLCHPDEGGIFLFQPSGEL
jgi:hypothetical protein